MYQLVKFDDQRWGVKIKGEHGQDEFLQPAYKTSWLGKSELTGSYYHTWAEFSYVMERCTMPEADARKLCSIMNKSIEDEAHEKALFDNATVIEGDCR